MNRKSWISLAAALACLAGVAAGGTFGTVVPIGGHASDLALDEARGVLYIANYTANRIEVMSLSDNRVRTSMNVASQPTSLALSPDGRFLVITHFANFTAPNTPRNALTVIDLANSNQRQTFALGHPPLGVAFGLDNRALIVTTSEFVLFDPLLGTTQVLETIEGVTAKTLPQPPANFPLEIVAASMAASADGLKIYGLTDTIRFRYDTTTKNILSLGYSASPPLGPRTVSVAADGTYWTAGWAMFNSQGLLTSAFVRPSGELNIGSHAIDSSRGVIYAQIPEASTGENGSSETTTPVLQVVAADNLEVKERLNLPENLAGKGILSSDHSTMYAISDSGITVLPVGSFSQSRRLMVATEDLVFRGNFCDRRVATQEFTILDPSGGGTDFTITSDLAGVTVTPSSGVTPATVRVRVDPNAFQNQKGTVAATLSIKSSRAVNVPDKVRVLVNVPEPDQRGSFVNVPGKLVDLVADPVRNRFYVLRQDTNEVLVFDASTQSQIAVLRTGNQPMQMAITTDRRYLLVANNAAQYVSVFDLDTLEPSQSITMPRGHFAKSVAAAGNTILVLGRNSSSTAVIDRADLFSRTASMLPTLGVYENTVNVDSVLVGSPNGSSILLAQADGNVMLYDANVDTFTVSRKDFPSLSGGYAASSFNQFVVGNHLLNSSLVPVRQFDDASGSTSGFAFVDNMGFRTSASSASSPGVIQRLDLETGALRATRMVEAPVMSATDQQSSFTRTIAPLPNRSALINLSTSGVTVLPWTYDTAVATPRIERVVNAADLQQPIAPGGLISVFGRDLSPVNQATRQLPLPTALGESCLTVNGFAVPMLFVSNNQINAQLPIQAEGNVTMILRTPGGVSDNYNLRVQPTAPSVFRNGAAGPVTDIPLVYRSENRLLVTDSNPVHRGDTVVLYLTGMGLTSPVVPEGTGAPQDPVAKPVTDPTVSLGGVGLPVISAHLIPGQIGVYEVTATVPHTVPLGFDQQLVISQGSSATTIPVRVVN